MALSELTQNDVRLCIRRILESRMRILCNHGFYGLLLMHAKFGLTDETRTACTDGRSILFASHFLDVLDDRELDFVMMHEVLHMALGHCQRGLCLEPEQFNIACDIVVNSNILKSNGMDLRSITIRGWGGPSMHIAPDGREGFCCTAEEVYELLGPSAHARKKNRASSSPAGGATTITAGGQIGDASEESSHVSWDDHSQFGTSKHDGAAHDEWSGHLRDACEAMERRVAAGDRGVLPAFAQRLLGELRCSRTDWRTALNDFIRQDFSDYSFSPPDRRFNDLPFFLPDFNEAVDHAEHVLFMIDTSASVSDEMVSAACSEVKHAIDQFDGRLEGWFGFFDAQVAALEPFHGEDAISKMNPIGGGGTSFKAVFDYIADVMADNPPAGIVILTDGYAPFPAESAAMGIPVLWLLNNDEVTPPWGKIARM